MKQLLGLSICVAMVTACQTTPTRVIEATTEYTAPSETAEQRDAMRPDLTEWCNDYFENMEGAVLSCKMFDDVILFNLRLKPQYEWESSGIEEATNELSKWACEAFSGPLESGYAFATQLDGSSQVKITTIDNCMAED